MKIVLLLWLLVLSPVYANDLDDGIQIDEPVNDDLQSPFNIEFLKRRVMAKTYSLKNSKKTYADQTVCGFGNIIIQPGSKIPVGTIFYNGSDNKNNNALCNR